MSFDSGMYAMEEELVEAVGALVSAMFGNVLSIGFNIVVYVFTALSLYCIAQRRGINHPWMAWIPVLNCWTLGSISDQYCYVVKGKVRNSRKVLLILEILKIAGVIAAVVMAVVAGVQAIMDIPNMEMMSEGDIVITVLKKFIPALGILGGAMVVMLTEAVFTAIAYYNLFASCEPDNKVLYLVLGLLIGITMPIFLFICRHKDLGMPARRAAQPQPEAYPVTEAPAEPWTKPEE